MVGFRRDYAPDWLDFEQHHAFRAEQVPVNLLSPLAAGEALASLASQAGFTLDQALVDSFIRGVTTPEGVSPVDVAIGLLGLANFVQQRGVMHVNKDDFATSGGAEGLLLSFAREKLEEIPEQVRARLLTGLVLALVDPSSDRRVAEGATAAQIAAKAEVPESLLTPYLERLEHPRIRLLEKFGAEHHRLPHERLVPVLRRMAGVVLARQDQIRILFEREFTRWMETKSRRRLLSGKDLRNALALRQSLVQGESEAQKSQYLAASVRRRTRNRILFSGATLILGGSSIFGAQFADAWVQRDRLVSWGLSPALFDAQYDADSIRIESNITHVGWLRSKRTSEVSLEFTGSDFAPLHRLTGLTSLTLVLGRSQVQDLTGLEKLKGLASLNLDLSGSQVKDLTGLEKLAGLTSLTLDPGNSQVRDLAALEKLTGLTSLNLELRGSDVKDLTGLEKLTRLTSLTLGLSSSQAKDLARLEKLTALTSLTLVFSSAQVSDLTKLEKLTALTSLKLDLRASTVKDLTALEKLAGLTSLYLDLRSSGVKDLTGLEKLTRLTSLTLAPSSYEVKDLTKLEKLTALTSLNLDLSFSPMKDLTGLEKLTGLTSLNLDLHGSPVNDLTGLENLTGLKSLNLDLSQSQVEDLTGLEKLTGLTSLYLDLRSSKVKDLAGLEKRKALTSLNLYLTNSSVQDLTELGQLTGLNSLTLDLNGSQVNNLSTLGKLMHLTTLRISAPPGTLSTFPGDDKIVRVADVSIRLSSGDLSIKIPHGFKSVELVE